METRLPESGLGLVFPNGKGNVEDLGNIIHRGLVAAQGGTDKAKYTGMHALRHFYASWCINRPEDGGLGLPPKVVQERMGHSSIVMTMNVYSHLFPRSDDSEQINAAEIAFLRCSTNAT
jgi:integrase